MLKTAILLIITFVVVPVVAYNLDDPLTDLQLTTLTSLIWVYGSAVVLTFLISSISKNYSQVDKLWSILPIIYSWIVFSYSGSDPRILLMAILVSIWGIRLSYNFYRRGGYSWKFWEGEEDYRWAVLREKPGFGSPLNWMLFNFFFVSLYQLGLILLFTIPILKCLDGGPIALWDYILALIILGFIVIETIADQQQWVYQNQKHKLKNSGVELKEPYSKGFVHSGLWKLVRHPNYAAEQGIWISFYFFSVTATGNWINWSLVGCLLLIILFKGSSDFSEEISADKYTAYKDYIKSTPRFIPGTKRSNVDR